MSFSLFTISDITWASTMSMFRDLSLYFRWPSLLSSTHAVCVFHLDKFKFTWCVGTKVRSVTSFGFLDCLFVLFFLLVTVMQQVFSISRFSSVQTELLFISCSMLALLFTWESWCYSSNESLSCWKCARIDWCCWEYLACIPFFSFTVEVLNDFYLFLFEVFKILHHYIRGRVREFFASSKLRF